MTHRRLLTALVTALLAAVLAFGALSPPALADGDPGSDVLVFQRLFAGSDAGLSVGQQAQLGGLLRAAAKAGLPVRVALIAAPADLGSVTALWRRPRAYARFLGLELSLAYKGRLVVVMPNGIGFNWPGHGAGAAARTLAGIGVGAGAGGLFGAAEAAVRRLAAGAGVTLRRNPTPTASTAGTSAGAAPSQPPTPMAPSSSSGHAADTTAAVIALVVALLATALALFRRRLLAVLGAVPRRRLAPALALLVVAAVAAPVVVLAAGRGGRSEQSALAANPYLDPGRPLSGAAPDFTLSDQFGRALSLHSLRGRVVILAFTDSHCTTICPLTTNAMLDAKAMLGAAGSRVQLLGIDANPRATSLDDVWSYSELHGMQHAWRFLTGSLPSLRRVWKDYYVEAAVDHGQIDHTPALFVIGPDGREEKLFVTQQSYAAIGQLGRLLAQSASRLLPDHPPVHAEVSYARIPGIPPARRVTLPRADGGTLELGPGRARLQLFFATWDRGLTGLGAHLQALGAYAASARRHPELPPLSAVDEAAVEPGPGALGRFLHTLPHPLPYPVAVDRSGRVADGYEVQGVPWFVLTSASGRILWYRQVDTEGWPSTAELERQVRAALARGPSGPAGVGRLLVGSPAPLRALHRQASRLLSDPGLPAQIRSLRGYPIVVNAWASWCGPCRAEFGLLASASSRYGRQVAFVGANAGDSSPDARAFLSQHPVSYPSYATTLAKIQSLTRYNGLPDTIFMDRRGRIVFVHHGEYASQGSLDADIAAYALRPARR